MQYKVFTKAMKVLIIGTLIIMAFTKDNVMDWLLIGFTGGWLVFIAAYLIYKSGKREGLTDDPTDDPADDEAAEDPMDPDDEPDPPPDPTEAESWYRMIGSRLLTDAMFCCTLTEHHIWGASDPFKGFGKFACPCPAFKKFVARGSFSFTKIFGFHRVRQKR